MKSSPKSRKKYFIYKKKPKNYCGPNKTRMIYKFNNKFNKACYLKMYTSENIYYYKKKYLK